MRSEKAKQTWEEFQRVQIQIEEENGVNEETEKYRSDFENLYFESMAKCKRFVKATDCATIVDSDSTENSARVSSKISEMTNQAFVKLAALQIPQFSGAYTDWASFHDIFSALVHKNEALSDIQKFFTCARRYQGTPKT